MHGLVIKNTGSWYTVRTDEGLTVECKVKGNFRLKGIRTTNPVAIGDGVDIVQGPDGHALITSIDNRKNYIIRKATNLSKQSHILAANIDQCMLIVTINYPETSTTFIDRFLANAEAYSIPAVLVFNKTDLITDDQDKEKLQELTAIYQSIGYECLHTSTITGEGMEPLMSILRGKVTLLSGNSGVGKSTIINTLFPNLNLKTSEISDAYNTGKHTTTFSEMYPIDNDGYIIDTPGIKGFGTFDMQREEISHYFREIFNTSSNCRFGNCTHTHEPGCAVLEAVEDGRIAISRFNSYLSMLDDQDEDKYRPAVK
ncbi:MAG: ribosome small subunit-dependent GTPase A [Bacteroidaceae bacterium]|nr:ribosome small subunit-dependent GTPase A [Bacteroidaceae bacterium]